MRLCIAFLLFISCATAYAQSYSLRGKVTEESNDSAVVADIMLTQKNILKQSGKSGADGLFR